MNPLYESAIKAIQAQDIAKGQELLKQLLEQDPNNDMTWVWLARITNDRTRQIEMLERVLTINPDNAIASQILFELQSDHPQSIDLRNTITYQRMAALQPPNELPAAQQARIKQLLKDAKEDEIDTWLAILKIQPDHDTAMRNAVQLYVKQGDYESAKHLVHNAINANTHKPSIYFTAMDFARRENNDEELETLRNQLLAIDGLGAKVYLRLAESYINEDAHDKAQALLKEGIRIHPNDSALLLKLGDLLENHYDNKAEAFIYYNRAATNPNTEYGQEADKRLAQYAPVITDMERGSAILAIREAIPFPIIYLMLAWQDTGTNLTNVNGLHWLGILLSVIGGYLLITATSSPQQTVITKLTGGEIPIQKKKDVLQGAFQGTTHDEPTKLPMLSSDMRFIIGGIGIVILMVAFFLVFSTSIRLLLDPVPINLDWWYR